MCFVVICPLSAEELSLIPISFLESSTSSDPNMKKVFSFIRFRLSLDETVSDLLDDSDDDPNGWKEKLAPLGEAEGRYCTSWGRIVESPEEVLMISGWHTEEDIANFVASAAYGTFLEAIGPTDKTQSPLVTVVGRIKSNFLTGWVLSHTLSFPQPLPDKTKQMFGEVVGLRGSVGGGMDNFKNSPDKAIPAQKGWVQETRVSRGLPVERAMLMKAWWSPEAEMEFKDEASAMDRWRKELEDLNPVEVTEEHCNLVQT